MSTLYTASVTRYRQTPEGVVVDYMLHFNHAPAYEVAPALKQLAKKIHESPPPVVLDGQEAML